MYLRSVRGVTRLDKIRNQAIREDLNILSILDFEEQGQLAWWGHINRLAENRMTRRIWEARSTRRKKRGRPRRTYTINVIGTNSQQNF